MKKLFFLAFILSLIISCDKEETGTNKNFWGFHVKDTTGLKILKVHGVIPDYGGNPIPVITPNNSFKREIYEMFKQHFLANTEKETDITYLIGLRNRKLWIGKFNVTTREQLHEWISQEDFITRRTVNLGYGDIREYDFDLRQSDVLLVVQNDDNIAIVAAIEGGYKDLYFAYRDSIKIYNNEDDIDFLGEWDNGFVSWTEFHSKPSKFYTSQGDLLFNANVWIDLWRCISINTEEAIYDRGLDDLSRINLKTGKTIWKARVSLNGVPSDAKLSYEITLKENNFWTYTINIIYYSGEKEKRQFKINLDNGEIEYL